MRRSIAERRLCRLALILLAALGARGAIAQLPISRPTRLVNVIEVNDHEDQVDLTMVFNCSMRFITSLPASEGRQVHIQLAPMPDCGVSQLSQLLAETPPVSGGANIITAARVDYGATSRFRLATDSASASSALSTCSIHPHACTVKQAGRTTSRNKPR